MDFAEHLSSVVLSRGLFNLKKQIIKKNNMKKLITSFTLLLCSLSLFAQIDKEQLALDVSKADAANTEKLKAFLWKRYSTATVDGAVKATVITEFSFDEKGEIQATQTGGETTVKDKPGLRGRAQQNAMEDNMDYIEKALKLSISYTFMSKGQLLDFFEKATITEVGNTYEVTGTNVYVQGDKLTVVVEKDTKLFLKKTFSSMLDDKNPVDGVINYEKFSSGVSHGSTTVLNLPAKKAKIDAVNKDYSQRVN
jgi:hypothetical protein